MRCFKLPGDRVLAVSLGDITKARSTAIVNPANSLMVMGGGVAGAIKRAGGAEIEEEAVRRAPVPVGRAIVTRAGKLPCRFVIHAPTMEKPAMSIPLSNVELATRAALEAATNMDLDSVAFPAMGAGVGGLSVRESSRAMASVIREHVRPLPKVILLLARSREAYDEMVEGVESVLGAGYPCGENLARYL